MDTMELELRDYLRILRKRRWYLGAVLVVVLVATAALTILTTPSYRAESKLFIGERQVAVEELQEGTSVVRLSRDLLHTYAEMIRTRPIAERAVEVEGLDLSPSRLARQLRAEPVRDTQIIRLSYDHADPGVAQRVVNAVGEAFVAEIEQVETPETPGAQPAVRVRVVEPALQPESPTSPQPVRNMALGLVLGLMLGVGIAFLAEYLDTTVKDREDVEAGLGIPVLGAVPKIDTHGAEVYIERDPQSSGSEAFRKLRTAIQFLGVDDPVRVLLVTSPFAREGKTTTALNLATVYAQAGLQTLLVEADLRRPSLHHIFAADGRSGLTTALVGRVPLDRAILPTTVRNLVHIPAGALPPNPSELLGSRQMADTIEELRKRFDMVIVDAPPILPVADAAALATRVDGVLLVARVGETNRDRLLESAQLVGKVGGRLLGVALNFQKIERGGYGYQYYSGYRRHEPSFQTREEDPSKLLASPAGVRADLGDPSSDEEPSQGNP